MGSLKQPLLFLAFLSLFSVAFAEKHPMLSELKRDRIQISIPKESKTSINPLQSIRPRTYKSTALDYEFHSFSELAEDGITYPVYIWELPQNSSRYELARYKQKGSLIEFAAYAQLDEAEKNMLLAKTSQRLISGALTKKTLTCLPKERFVLIGKKNLFTLDQLVLITEDPAPQISTTDKPEDEAPTPQENTVKASDEPIAGLEPFAVKNKSTPNVVFYPKKLTKNGKTFYSDEEAENPSQPIDVSGMKEGERMRCPYTGRIFRVP